MEDIEEKKLVWRIENLDTTLILENKKLKKMKNAYLVIGLPGIGLIGKTVGDYLVNELKSTKISELYSPYFPHQVFMSESGILKPITNTFYHVKAGKNNLIVLVGDVQAISSHGQYEIAGKILDYAKKLGVKTVISVGGYSSGKLGKNKGVFGLVTNKKLISKLKKIGIEFGKAKGSIVGEAGLLPTLSAIKGMDGVCILGETHGAYVDPSSARDIVKILTKYLNFKISLTNLEKKAKEGEKIIKKIEQELKQATIQQPPQLDEGSSVSYIR